jgi:putative Holliday junction resolvase
VDWGQKRFGVALSDETRMLASALTTITRRPKQRAPVGKVAELANQNDVSEIIVGHPLDQHGNEGESALAARDFADHLRQRTSLPVHLVDERMSTARALRAARAAGVSDRDSKHRIDQMAAVVLLQSWLDQQGNAGTGASGHG